MRRLIRVVEKWEKPLLIFEITVFVVAGLILFQFLFPSEGFGILPEIPRPYSELAWHLMIGLGLCEWLLFMDLVVLITHMFLPDEDEY